MQRTRAKIPVLFMIITATGACALHFLQLYRQSDDTKNEIYSYLVYLLILAGFAFSALYASFKKDLAKTFDLENGKRSIFWSSAVLALSFFYDFIHQGYNCYSYIISTSYVDYTYVIPLGITGLFALISCFYFLALAMTAKNTNYDFRNFTLMHFAPVIWAFTKLFGIMLQIVDIRVNVEVCCEFILLCVILCFLFSMISGIDKCEASATRVFVFSSLMLAFMASIVTVPRIAMIVIGKAGETEPAVFSSVTYIMLGIFSLTLLFDVNKRSGQKQ